MADIINFGDYKRDKEFDDWFTSIDKEKWSDYTADTLNTDLESADPLVKKRAQNYLQRQITKEMQNSISNIVFKTSEGQSSKYKLPTLYSGFPKDENAIFVWQYQLNKIRSVLADENQLDKMQRFIAKEAQTYVPKLFQIISNDMVEFRILQSIAAKAPSPEYPINQVEGAIAQYNNAFKDLQNWQIDTKPGGLYAYESVIKIGSFIKDTIPTPVKRLFKETKIFDFNKEKKKKQSNDFAKGIADVFSTAKATQKNIEVEIQEKINQIKKESKGYNFKYMNPTILSGFQKGINPIHAWYFALSSIVLEGKNVDEMSDRNRFVFNRAVDVIDELIEITKEDIEKLKILQPLAVKAIAPQYPRQKIDYAVEGFNRPLEIFIKFKRKYINDK